MASREETQTGLALLDPQSNHDFQEPVKKINEGPHVAFFQTTKAYTDIMTFLLQLNASMFPEKMPDSQEIQTWDLGSDAVTFPPPVLKLRGLLDAMASYIARARPDTGPRRFGNISFRRWHALVEADAAALLDTHLPPLGITAPAAKTELKAYLLGSFGSPQRLDYGTGHELSFLAFLAGVWKLGGVVGHGVDGRPGAAERALVLGVLQPYLALVRRLITTYTLEPAGSHGVWGLDDHSFVPYVLGAAQLGPARAPDGPVPTEGSRADAPAAGAVADAGAVAAQAPRNLYFGAVAFILAVKRGPFWEHSPVLYDISGVRAGWGKINKGMLKMYAAEVLAKFPVVQHFPFGGLFRWESEPGAAAPLPTAHTASQPDGAAGAGAVPTTRAPWATGGAQVSGAGASAASMPPTRAPWAQAAPVPSRGGTGMPATKTPWASDAGAASASAGRQPAPGPTKAPWAKER